MDGAPAGGDDLVGAIAKAAGAIEALREERRRAIVKRRWSAGDMDAFAAAFGAALPALAARFGRVMDRTRRVRTQPEDEALMRAAAAAFGDLGVQGAPASLFDAAAGLAVLTFYVGDSRQALEWVNLAARIDGEEPHNKLNGAVLAAEFLDFGLALRLVEEVMLEKPDWKAAWALKARALQGLRLAEESGAAGLEKGGDVAGARDLRRRAAGRVEGARSALREVVRIDPKDASACYELGKFEFTHGRLKEAAAAYGQAVAVDPSLKLAWYQKGTAHQMLEQVDEALEAFARGLALDRRDASGIHFKIASLNALKGQADKAFEWIASGLALNKPNFYAEISRIEFAALAGDPRWQPLVESFFADTGFKHTKAAQAEVGFSWGLFEHGSVLFYDSLADAFAVAEAARREGDLPKAREFYEKLAGLLEREGHMRKAAIVRGRLATLAP